KGKWGSYASTFRPNDQVPGDGKPPTGFWTSTMRALEHLLDDWEDVAHRFAHVGKHVLQDALDHAKPHAAAEQAGEAPSATYADHPRFAAVLRVVRGIVWDVARLDLDLDELRWFFMKVDTVTTLIIGAIDDRLAVEGIDSINHLDLRDWLTGHGLNPISL